MFAHLIARDYALEVLGLVLSSRNFERNRFVRMTGTWPMGNPTAGGGT
jgi:hypothetical protein